MEIDMDMHTYYTKLAQEWINDATRHQAAGFHIFAEECRRVAMEYFGRADAYL
jgi:hypothetical protein